MRTIYTLVVILFFTIVQASSVTANENTEKMERVGSLENVSGEVYVKRSGGLQKFSAYNGIPILEGDYVETSANASVTLLLEEDEMALGEFTKVHLARLAVNGKAKETKIKQLSGQTWNKVKSLLNANDTHDVETATSVMGVRGTLFSIVYDQVTRIETLSVFEGLVENTLMREQRNNQSGQGVIVSEQMDISLETGERIIGEINYDEAIERLDVSIMAVIYEDILERADQLYEENEDSIFENATIEKQRILLSLHLDMMLESLDKLTEAIMQANEAKREQITDRLKQTFAKNLIDIHIEILEKRLRQIEQYDRLLERAEMNDVDMTAFDEFVAANGGEKAVERMKQLEEIKLSVNERLQEKEQENAREHTIIRENDSLIEQPARVDRDSTGVNDPPIYVELPAANGEKDKEHETNEVENHPEDEENPGKEDPPEDEENPGTEAPPGEDNNPGQEDPPEDEDDPEQNNPPLDDDDDNENNETVPPPVMNDIEPLYLEFDHIVEAKKLEQLFVDQNIVEDYTFGNLIGYDENIIVVNIDTTKQEMTIKGISEGNTEVAVEIIDKSGIADPVIVNLEVIVENILPNTVTIAAAHKAQLEIMYDHEAEQLRMKKKPGTSGFLNGWLVNEASLLPIYDYELDEYLEHGSDNQRIRHARRFGCSTDAFLNRIPDEICLQIDDIEKETNSAVTIVPIIDTFDMTVEGASGEVVLSRDLFFENTSYVQTILPSANYHRITWKVTYEKGGVSKTEDYRDFLIANKTNQNPESIFTELIACLPQQNQQGIPISLCIQDETTITNITGVFSSELPNDEVKNTKNVPYETEFIDNTSVMKLNFNDYPEVISRLFAVRALPGTTLIENSQVPLEFYLYSDEMIQISIDFIEFPIEVVFEGSVTPLPEIVGKIEHYPEFIVYGSNNQYEYQFDYWAFAYPEEGYLFKHWRIIFEEQDELFAFETDINIYEYMNYPGTVSIQAVFE